jgi:hypothetical protein
MNNRLALSAASLERSCQSCLAHPRSKDNNQSFEIDWNRTSHFLMNDERYQWTDVESLTRAETQRRR